MTLPSEAAPATSLSVTPYLRFLIFVTTLGALQFGYHLAELNAPQAVITCEKKSINAAGLSSFAHSILPQCIPMTPAQFGLVSSSYTLGGLFGALAAGPFSTTYGRLRVLRATTIFFIIGPLAETLAGSITVLAVGRFLSGIGAGASVVVGPIYIAEVAPPDKRGILGASTQILTNVGILLSQSLGFFLSRGRLWRVILAIAGVLALVQSLGLCFVPESPVWLAEHQRVGLAKRVLQRIRGSKTDIESEVLSWKTTGGLSNDDNNETAASNIEEEPFLTPPTGNPNPKKPPVSILGVLGSSTYRPAIIAVVAVMFAQQFTGINSIIMYSVSLLSAILPTAAPLLAVAVSALNLVATVLCAPLADKLGRKPTILLSIIGMGINSALLAIGIAFDLKFLSAFATLLFVASFAAGLGPIPFILASELVGPEAVGATQSWALAASWTATFVVAQFFPVLNETMGGKGRIYWIFTAMAVLFSLFLTWWLPETRGKSSMDEVWGRAERRVD